MRICDFFVHLKMSNKRYTYKTIYNNLEDKITLLLLVWLICFLCYIYTFWRQFEYIVIPALPFVRSSVHPFILAKN